MVKRRDEAPRSQRVVDKARRTARKVSAKPVGNPKRNPSQNISVLLGRAIE
jgi:hypothetical protein